MPSQQQLCFGKQEPNTCACATQRARRKDPPERERGCGCDDRTITSKCSTSAPAASTPIDSSVSLDRSHASTDGAISGFWLWQGHWYSPGGASSAGTQYGSGISRASLWRLCGGSVAALAVAQLWLWRGTAGGCAAAGGVTVRCAAASSRAACVRDTPSGDRLTPHLGEFSPIC